MREWDLFLVASISETSVGRTNKKLPNNFDTDDWQRVIRDINSLRIHSSTHTGLALAAFNKNSLATRSIAIDVCSLIRHSIVHRHQALLFRHNFCVLPIHSPLSFCLSFENVSSGISYAFSFILFYFASLASSFSFIISSEYCLSDLLLCSDC